MPTPRAAPRPLVTGDGRYDRSAITSAAWAFARAALIPVRLIRGYTPPPLPTFRQAPAAPDLPSGLRRWHAPRLGSRPWTARLLPSSPRRRRRGCPPLRPAGRRARSPGSPRCPHPGPHARQHPRNGRRAVRHQRPRPGSRGRAVKSRRYSITLDDLGLAKPARTRISANRSRHWWARRCPGLVEVRRDKGPIR